MAKSLRELCNDLTEMVHDYAGQWGMDGAQEHELVEEVITVLQDNNDGGK